MPPHRKHTPSEVNSTVVNVAAFCAKTACQKLMNIISSVKSCTKLMTFLDRGIMSIVIVLHSSLIELGCSASYFGCGQVLGSVRGHDLGRRCPWPCDSFGFDFNSN